MLMSSKILLFRTYLSSLHLASSAVWSLVHFLSLGDFFASKGSPFQNLFTYTQNHSTTSEFYSNSVSALLKGPRQANLVLIAYASSEGSGEPAHPRSLARTFAARSYKQ